MRVIFSSFLWKLFHNHLENLEISHHLCLILSDIVEFISKLFFFSFAHSSSSTLSCSSSRSDRWQRGYCRSWFSWLNRSWLPLPEFFIFKMEHLYLIINLSDPFIKLLFDQKFDILIVIFFIFFFSYLRFYLWRRCWLRCILE